MLSFKHTKYEKELFSSDNGLVGISNINGVSCYLNSILQCLSKTPHFAKIFFTEEGKNSWKKNLNNEKYGFSKNFKAAEFVNIFRYVIINMWNHTVNDDDKIEICKKEQNIDNHIDITPKNLFLYIVKDFPDYQVLQQQDSSEVLIYILDILSKGFTKNIKMNINGNPRTRLEKLEYDSLIALKKSLPTVKIENDINNNSNSNSINTEDLREYSIIHELFYGQFINVIESLDGKVKRTNYEVFTTLPIEININNEDTELDLSDCLKNFYKPCILDGDNKWYHEETKQKYDAQKYIKILNLPNILIINFKRNIWDFDESTGSVVKRKNLTIIKFPQTLDMKPYLYEPNLLNDPDDAVYELYAVSSHMGVDFVSGHYFSNCKIGDNWYVFNDQSISKINNIYEIVNNRAYILFYKRKTI